MVDELQLELDPKLEKADWFSVDFPVWLNWQTSLIKIIIQTGSKMRNS